jgi:hypothetical protein
MVTCKGWCYYAAVGLLGRGSSGCWIFTRLGIRSSISNGGCIYTCSALLGC